MIDEKLIDTFVKENIPVYGMGSASLMNNLQSGYRPQDLLPSAKSIICFGMQIPESIYRLKRNRVQMIWRSQNLLYRKLDSIALHLSGLLENYGHDAIPTVGCIPITINEEKTIVGYINQIEMARAVGLGIIGKNGMLLNSIYGPRLMLGGVVTSAELPALHVPEIELTECPSDCDLCVQSCPVNALHPDRKKIDTMRCLYHTFRGGSLSKIKFALLLFFNKSKAIDYLNMNAFDEHTLHICSECIISCPYGKT